jgi:hypothetical protein
MCLGYVPEKKRKKTLCSYSASDPYRRSDFRLSEKLLPTFADRVCYVVSTKDSHCRNLCFLDRSRYFIFQVARQLCSRSWVNPFPDPLLLRKSGSAGNRTRTSEYLARNSDHSTTEALQLMFVSRSEWHRIGTRDRNPLQKHFVIPHCTVPKVAQCVFALSVWRTPKWLLNKNGVYSNSSSTVRPSFRGIVDDSST